MNQSTSAEWVWIHSPTHIWMFIQYANVNETLTLGVDGRYVGPVVSLHYVHHGSGLLGVRWHDPHEVFVEWFVTEVHTGGGVRDLRDIKQLQQILHLNGHGTRTRTDQPHDWLLALHGRGSGISTLGPAPSLLAFIGSDERVPYELDALLQSDGGMPAGVSDLAAQRDVGEDFGVGVDSVQRVHHGFHALDAVLLPNRPAFALVHFVGRRLVVDGEEGTDDDVTGNVGHDAPLAGLARRHQWRQ